MNLLQFYGLDWFIFVVVIFHIYLVGEGRAVGWILGTIASILSIGLGILCGSLAMILMNVFYVFMRTWNYFKWKNRESIRHELH
jgi:nicotinamide riboside transporter PnuC